jgi:hypothetical protein
VKAARLKAMIVTAIRNMQEDIAKDGLVKNGSVSFSEDIKVFDIPALTDELAKILFYSTDQISKMKEEALMERAGVTVDDVGAEGQDLFQVEGIVRPLFRRKSLERVIRRDRSPTRSVSPRKRQGGASSSDDSVKPPAANVEIPAKPSPRQRDRRGRGAPERTRSSNGPSRSDGRGRGRGPPRRAQSSMAAVGGNTTNTLLAMQQTTIK